MGAEAVQRTAIDALPAVATTPVGAFGTAAGGAVGVTEFDTAEAPEPAALVATTENVYAVPLVRPVTVHDVVAEAQVSAPGDEVTAYPVIGEPPLLAGAVHDTLACPLPAVATTFDGTEGTVYGVADRTFDGAEAPDELTAATRNSY